MTLTEPSLENLLPVLYRGSYNKILEQEEKALRDIVKDILVDIKGRQLLGRHLLRSLEQQVMHIHSGLMNLRNNYTASASLDAIIGLEHGLEAIAVQKARTQEATARDSIELKKSLWHYIWMLKQKQAQISLTQ